MPCPSAAPGEFAGESAEPIRIVGCMDLGGGGYGRSRRNTIAPSGVRDPYDGRSASGTKFTVPLAPKPIVAPRPRFSSRMYPIDALPRLNCRLGGKPVSDKSEAL